MTPHRRIGPPIGNDEMLVRPPAFERDDVLSVVAELEVVNWPFPVRIYLDAAREDDIVGVVFEFDATDTNTGLPRTLYGASELDPRAMPKKDILGRICYDLATYQSGLFLDAVRYKGVRYDERAHRKIYEVADICEKAKANLGESVNLATLKPEGSA